MEKRADLTPRRRGASLSLVLALHMKARASPPRDDVGFATQCVVQGYLAHKKTPPP